MNNCFITRHFGLLSIVKDTYADGNLAILIVDSDYGMDVATLSVNLPQHAHCLRHDEFFAKTYSENEEIAQDALVSGLFQDTGVRVDGWPIWRCR